MLQYLWALALRWSDSSRAPELQKFAKSHELKLAWIAYATHWRWFVERGM